MKIRYGTSLINFLMNPSMEATPMFSNYSKNINTNGESHWKKVRLLNVI